MSACAFCGEIRTGEYHLAYRASRSSLRTVKVCRHCIEDACDAGYLVAGRVPKIVPRSDRTPRRLRRAAHQ
jgi:hypothetical protein